MICSDISQLDLQPLAWALFAVMLASVLVALALVGALRAAVDSQWLQDWRDRAYVRSINRNHGVASPAVLVAVVVVCLLAACASPAPTAITGSDQWWAKVRASSW